MEALSPRRAASADKQRGRTLLTSSDPANFVNHDSSDYNLTDRQAQHIASRHRVPNFLAREIARVHFGETLDD